MIRFNSMTYERHLQEFQCLLHFIRSMAKQKHLMFQIIFDVMVAFEISSANVFQALHISL